MFNWLKSKLSRRKTEKLVEGDMYTYRSWLFGYIEEGGVPDIILEDELELRVMKRLTIPNPPSDERLDISIPSYLNPNVEDFPDNVHLYFWWEDFELRNSDTVILPLELVDDVVENHPDVFRKMPSDVVEWQLVVRDADGNLVCEPTNDPRNIVSAVAEHGGKNNPLSVQESLFCYTLSESGEPTELHSRRVNIAEW